MSAKKSWDVVRREPARSAPRAQASRPAGRAAPVDMRPVAKKAAQVPVAAAPRITTRDVEHPRGGKVRPRESRRPLRAQRKERKKRFFVLLAILMAFLIGVAFYVLWLPILRIQEVQADGSSASDLHNIALRDMQGAYYFVIPKSSIFFVPEAKIRADVLAAHPEIEALSISAKDLNTLTLHTLERATAFWWCGESPAVPNMTCYDANAAGLIFEPASGYDASSTAMLRVYAPIDATTTDPLYPLNSHIQNAGTIPNALRFVKAIKGLGVNVASLSLRSDEADLYTQSGTRITYVLGREDQAAGLAATAFPQLSLNDGSLEYVDLRFPDKVYFKKIKTGE